MKSAARIIAGACKGTTCSRTSTCATMATRNISNGTIAKLNVSAMNSTSCAVPRTIGNGTAIVNNNDKAIISRQSSKSFATASDAQIYNSSSHHNTDANARLDRLKNDDSDYLLYDIPVGEMTYPDRSLAHRAMVAWQRTKSIEGAYLVQQILERLVEEDEAGNHRMADITARLYSIALKAWAYSGDDHCGQRAEAILGRMDERYRKYSAFDSSNASHDFEKARPNTRCYNLVLHALSQCREPDAAVRAEQLVQKMEEMSKEPHSTVSPQTSTYNCLMNTYASRIGEYGIGQKAEDVLLGMAEKNKDGIYEIHPDTTSFNIVLKAWLHSGEHGFESAKRAEQLLRLMAKLQQSGHDYVRPDSISFFTCFKAYTKADDDITKFDVVERLEGLIDLMEETGASGDDVTRCFNLAVSFIGKSGVDDAASRIERVVDRMRNSTTLHLQPASFQTKVSILDAEEKDGRDKAEEAEIILKDMIRDRTTHIHTGRELENDDVLLNDSIAFGTLLKITLKSGGAERGDKLLAMVEEASHKAPSLAPHKSHYHMVIDAYSKSNEKGSALNAFKLLKRQIKCFEEGNPRSEPTGFVYSHVITQLARSCAPAAEEKAYEVLMLMQTLSQQGNTDVVPMTVDYNCVIGLLGKVGTKSAAEKALSLFRKMEAEAEAGNVNVQPDVVTFSSVVNALGRSRHSLAPKVAVEMLRGVIEKEAFVDEAFFRHMIWALCTSRELKDVDKAYELLLDISGGTVDENGVNGVGARVAVDNAQSCNAVVNAYASFGQGTQAAAKAQTVLVDMVTKYRKGEIAALPDKYGFEVVIAAWSHSKDLQAMRNVETLFRLMKELHGHGCPNMEPDEQTITRAMPVYSNFAMQEGVVDRARKLFEQITNPDKKMYDSYLNLVAKSREPKKHQHAKAIVDEMRAASSSIDVGTYNIVLNACAFTSREEDKEGALVLANELFSEMRRRDECDCISYGTYIKVIRKCIGDEGIKRETAIQELLQESKRRGYMGHMVLKELKYEYGEQKMWDVLGIKGEHDVPMEWRRNVRKAPKQRPRRNRFC